LKNGQFVALQPLGDGLAPSPATRCWLEQLLLRSMHLPGHFSGHSRIGSILTTWLPDRAAMLEKQTSLAQLSVSAQRLAPQTGRKNATNIRCVFFNLA
jgi:hypothetical protein